MTHRHHTRIFSITGLLAVLLALPLVISPAAHAAELVATDPAGDTDRAGLDVVGVTVDNADYSLTVDVSYSRNRSGNTIVGLEAAGQGLLRLVNSHRADGNDRTRLYDNDGRLPCKGLTGTWRSHVAQLRLQIPSTCLWRGNYGSLRTWMLTEPLHSGEDVDLLTERARVARG